MPSNPVVRLARVAACALEAVRGAWLLGGRRRDRRPDWLLDEMFDAPRAVPAARDGDAHERRGGA